MLLAVPAAAGLAALTSCTSPGEAPQPLAPQPPAPVHPDVALRAAAVAREQTLIRAYDAALLAAPGLGDRLLALRAEHLTHLTSLGSTTPGSTPPGSTPPAGLKPGNPPPVAAPDLADAQLVGLRTAERAAGAGHTAALRTASAGLAVVLATLAASEASHEVALG